MVLLKKLDIKFLYYNRSYLKDAYKNILNIVIQNWPNARPYTEVGKIRNVPLLISLFLKVTDDS